MATEGGASKNANRAHVRALRGTGVPSAAKGVDGVKRRATDDAIYTEDVAVGTAGSVLNGIKVTTDGAVVTTTTNPGPTTLLNGVRVSASGAVWITTAGPGPTSKFISHPRLGDILVSADGAWHVA